MSTASQTLPLDSSTPAETARFRMTIAFVVVLVAFWQTWVSFPQTWMERGEHGFVVALFCGWLVWRHRQEWVSSGPGFGLASIAIAGLSLLWLVAFILNVRVIHQAAVPMVLLFWVLATAGVPAFRAALPIAGAFFLAVPLWDVLIPPLQAMTIVANGVLLKFTGIKAVIEGSLITIPAGIFEVAEGCAGINYFQVGVLVGTMHSLLFLRHWKPRIAAIALAAGLAIVSNWLRVFGLIVIGQVSNMQSSLVQDHATYGWIIFAVVLLAFFWLVRRIEAWDERLGKDVSATTQAISATAGGAVSRGTRSWPSVLVPTGAAVLGPLCYLLASGRPPAESSAQQVVGISPDSSWTLESSNTANSSPAAVDSSPSALWSPSYHGASEHRVDTWQRDSTIVQVDRFFYAEQSQGRELIGNLNRIAGERERIGGGLVGPLDDRGRMATVTAVRTPTGARLVWNWFRVAGVNTHFETEAKLLELVAFMSRSAASELVAVSTPCGATDCAEASRTLYRFVMGKEQPVSPGGATP